MALQDFPAVESDVTIERLERRHVYNGEFRPTGTETNVRRNRPLKRRKRSPLNIIFLLFVVSIGIVLYVWNKICVNRLAVEVNDLQNQYQKIVNVNEIMKADINKKSSLERIEKISVAQLNLKYAKEQPIWFEVEGEPR